MEERMTSMANAMAIAMAVVTEPFMPHSTPLLSTTSVVTLACGVSGSDQIQSHRYLRSLAAPIGFGGER